MHRGLAGQCQVAPLLAHDFVDESHRYPHMAKATHGDERTIRDKGLDGLCNRGTLVDEGPCFVVPNPGTILVWIVPAEWFASALC